MEPLPPETLQRLVVASLVSSAVTRFEFEVMKRVLLKHPSLKREWKGQAIDLLDNPDWIKKFAEMAYLDEDEVREILLRHIQAP
jgi:hypothetical protein